MKRRKFCRRPGVHVHLWAKLNFKINIFLCFFVLFFQTGLALVIECVFDTSGRSL